MLLGSVTELQEGHRGQAVVVGSHGGCATGWHALRCGIAALLCHDAGIGFEEAGVQALRVLQAAGRPCAAIGHMSARIGDPEDMLERGRVSRLNSAAALLGVVWDRGAVVGIRIVVCSCIADDLRMVCESFANDLRVICR